MQTQILNSELQDQDSLSAEHSDSDTNSNLYEIQNTLAKDVHHVQNEWWHVDMECNTVGPKCKSLLAMLQRNQMMADYHGSKAGSMLNPDILPATFNAG